MVIFLFTNVITVNANSSQHQKPPSLVIFETDIGNDIDDILAMDMLYKYADEGSVKILAINSNKISPYSVRMIDGLNIWYGYPKIPTGKVAISGIDTASNYAKTVYDFKTNNKRVFKTAIREDQVPLATEIYRKVLSQQADHSVIIISTGFSTNLAKLLGSKADKYSKATGMELVTKKVKFLSVMAGNFEDPAFHEFNVEQDISDAQKIFSEWPTPVICSPFELGEKILYPASSIENDFKWTAHHPMVIGYENYLKMPYDRPTWDLTAVLYAVEGLSNYFDQSPTDKLSVNDQGATHFTADPAGLHRYLKANV
ncbi:MAG: nucleoside hydrolase [Sphingobacteriaceae bacterium]